MAMKVTRAVVPSLFTVLNMFCGFLSIIHSSKSEFLSAAWFIGLAALFDALDGVMARLTRSTSDFGVEIDSLSDVVSFGAAPAFLAYMVDLQRLEGAGILLSSLLMIFGGLRLARFNVQLIGHDKDHFVGLPIPVSALTVVSLVIIAYRDEGGLAPWASALFPWLCAALGLLMVSKVRYDTLPRPNWRGVKREPVKFIVLGAAVVLAAVTGGAAVFPIMLGFILLGVLRWSIETVRAMTRSDLPAEEEEHTRPTQADL